MIVLAGATVLHAAVIAAMPGDIVVVRDGDYINYPAPLQIDKGIVILGDATSQLQLIRPARVRFGSRTVE